MKVTVEIPKPMFQVGDAFVTEYSNVATIVAPAMLEVADKTKFGRVVEVSFEYYYSVQIAMGERVSTYYLDEEHISTTWRIIEPKEEKEYEV